MIIYIIMAAVYIYLLIGSIFDAVLREEGEKASFVMMLVWPIVLIIGVVLTIRDCVVERR